MRPIVIVSVFTWLVLITACSPSPFNDHSWATQRPFGASYEAYRPPRQLDDEAAYQAKDQRVEPLTGNLSLRDAMASALRGNPDLARFGYDVRAAEARVVQAGLWSNPQLAVDVEDVAGSNDFSGADAAQVTLMLSQTFPLGGDIQRRKELAGLQGQLAGWDYEAARISLLAEVTQRYVNVLAAQRRVQLAIASLALAKHVADSIAGRVEAGDAPAVERFRAAVPLATSAIALRQAEQSLESARVELALTWGSTAPVFKKVLGDLDRVEPLPSVSALALLISQNPQVARWVTEIASRQAQVQLIAAQAVPDLTAGLGYRWFNETDDSALVGGVSIPLPIFDRRQGDILAARFGVASARNQHRAVELQIEAALSVAYARLANAQTQAIALRDDALPPATAAYQAIRKAFDQGNLGFLDVLDAERTLIDLRNQYLDALAVYHGSAAQIEGLIGQSLDSVGLATSPKNKSNPDGPIASEPKSTKEPKTTKETQPMKETQP